MPSQPHSDERRSDLAVMGSNEYKQKRRLERILDAHDNVEEKADEAWDLYVLGELDSDGKNIMILRAVKKAIRESYNLIQDHRQNEDSIRNYWIRDDPVGKIEFQRRQTVYFHGLKDILNAQEMYKEEWVVDESGRHYFKPQRKMQNIKTVPERVSWNGYKVLKEFLNNEHDLELQFEEMDNSRPYIDWREDYEDGVYG